MRVTYMGTPEYAVPTLRMLATAPDVQVGLVVTQPDRPQGRGRILQSPPVKLAADELGVPVLQAATLRDPEARGTLEASAPDLIVVAAFGLILGPRTLNLPRLGCVNLHASILPAYRGANPIAAAIAAGEHETGVTLMRMDRGLDTGPILAIAAMPIPADATTGSLTPQLAQLGADLLENHLGAIADGSLQEWPQPAGATETRQMTKDDGWIDWSQPAERIEAHIRAMQPWPRAWTTLPDGTRIQIHAAAIEGGSAGTPGAVTLDDQGVSVATGSGTLRLRSVQFPGGRPLEARALLDRMRPLSGTAFGTTGEPTDRSPLVVPA